MPKNSAYLPESTNYFRQGRMHRDVQKFDIHNDHDDEIFKIFINFIKNKFIERYN